MRILALLLTLTILQNSVWANKRILYVSPNGNDDWSGTFADVQTSDGPLATLNAARLKVRQLKAAHHEDTFEVQIRGGIYKLNETVVFGILRASPFSM